MAKLKKLYFVLQIVGDIEPHLHGPFKTAEARDDRAAELRSEDRDKEDGLYKLECATPIRVEAYESGMLEDLVDEIDQQRRWVRNPD